VVNRAGIPIAPTFTYLTGDDPPVNFRVEADLPRAMQLGLDTAHRTDRVSDGARALPF
jgi:hypothetical protein